MSDIDVEPLTLTIASMKVQSSSAEIEGARTSLKGTHGALAGTPAEGAFAALATTAVATSTGFADASSALAVALRQAASAYWAADASVTAGLKGSGP